MSVIIGLIFLTIIFTIGFLLQKKKAPAIAKTFSLPKGVFVHPGHSWAKLIEPNLVSVGADQFTRSIFGSVEEARLPKEGDTIRQGGRAWSLKRGERELVQTAPLSGEIVEVNQDLLSNPGLYGQKDAEENWMFKVRPTGLKKELRNLLHGSILARWNQAMKEQLVDVLGTAQFQVLQDGGDIVPNLGDSLTDQQWEKARREFFNYTGTKNRKP